jgi:CRP-like cAMP-binding protein
MIIRDQSSIRIINKITIVEYIIIIVIFITVCQGVKNMDESALFNNCATRVFNKNQLIIAPDKNPSGVYKIIDGFVVVYGNPVAGKRKIQAILKPGDFFPLVWTIQNKQKNLCFAALTKCTTCFVTKQNFLHVLNTNKKAADEIINMFATYLSMYIDRVDNLECENLQKKLVSRLLFFTSRFGKKVGEGITIEVPLTHSLIAESINVARENVTRELKILKDKKLLSFAKRHLVILNPKKLSAMLGV